MSLFKVVKFDSDNVADKACKELFQTSAQVTKDKHPIKQGKITKKKKKDTIKNNLTTLSNKNLPCYTKIKKNRDKQKNQGKLQHEHETKNAIKTYVTVNSDVPPLHIKTKVKNRKRKKKNQNFTEEDSIRNEVKTILEGNAGLLGDAKKKKKRILQFKQVTNEENTSKKKNKKRKKSNKAEVALASDNTQKEQQPLDYESRKREKLNEKLRKTLGVAPEVKKEKHKVLNLRERMMQKLQAARFRYINEQIYSNDSKEAHKIFKEDPDAFKAYHDGYRLQVNKWPMNPLDVIIKSVQKLPKTHIIADFGCGDAKLATSVVQKVHSFDLVAANDSVSACDMAHVPLESTSVDVVVFCLSLMGTNLREYLLEANRVLKVGGILKVAEVESRFDDVNKFIEALKRFHFKNIAKDLSQNLFYFLDFKKESNIKNKKKLPTITLHPCLYKKR